VSYPIGGWGKGFGFGAGERSGQLIGRAEGYLARDGPALDQCEAEAVQNHVIDFD